MVTETHPVCMGCRTVLTYRFRDGKWHCDTRCPCWDRPQ